MNHTELRFGTVVSVSGRTALVRFPGAADPVPVSCVSGLPTAGQKVACWQTRHRIYYLGAGNPLRVGGLVVSDDGGGFSRLAADSQNVQIKAGSTTFTVGYNGPARTNRETVGSDAATTLTTKGYVDALRASIKAAAAASTDFNDFKARIAQL